GIRDKLVTGVQTFALPIYFWIRHRRHSPLRRRLRAGNYQTGLRDEYWGNKPTAVLRALVRAGRQGARHLYGRRLRHTCLFAGWRSEERRVGNECRSEWWW